VRVEADDEGMAVVIGGVRTASCWSEVVALVHCGLLTQDHVRVVRTDGRRIVLGARAVPLLEQHAPPARWTRDPRSSLRGWYLRSEHELAQPAFRRR
jgi:hypothetical protein